jgi:hypothetical protein
MYRMSVQRLESKVKAIEVSLDGVDALFDNDFSLFIGAKPPVAWLPRSDAEWKELSEQEQKTVRVKDRRLHLTVELKEATSWLASAKVTRLLVRILTFVDAEKDAQSLCGQGHYHAVSRPHCRWLHRQGAGARAGQCRGRGGLDPGEVFNKYSKRMKLETLTPRRLDSLPTYLD